MSVVRAHPREPYFKEIGMKLEGDGYAAEGWDDITNDDLNPIAI